MRLATPSTILPMMPSVRSILLCPLTAHLLMQPRMSRTIHQYRRTGSQAQYRRLRNARAHNPECGYLCVVCSCKAASPSPLPPVLYSCTNTTCFQDIAFQEICNKHNFKEPVNEKDDDDAADGDEPDSDPDEDDKAYKDCVCTENGCSNDSRPCCANNSCGPW
jgi:hypothetical protein